MDHDLKKLLEYPNFRKLARKIYSRPTQLFINNINVPICFGLLLGHHQTTVKTQRNLYITITIG